MTVVDVGAGENPHPEADITVDQRPVADRQADLDGEWPIETGAATKVVARHVVEHLTDPTHAFREAARVLRVGGTFEVVVPLGDCAVMDDGHETRWTWRSPVQYCRVRGRGWDPEVPFVLGRRGLDVRWRGPLADLSPLLQAAADRWPQWACNRCDWGELTALYRRVKT